MFLKRLELTGFKTFAPKTALEFAPGITCIVGPNGCGKSNLSDAIRWVLGEQSIKTLRGSTKMEEVIFAGTQARKPLSMAEVSVIFDNSDQYLPIEFQEVSVSRRLFRAGENTYYINKAPSRLRDLYEVFSGTGLGQGAFCILSQSEIDLVLSSNSQDRRAIIEETAGVAKYKFRKKEAARKLEHTHNNLVRLRDIQKEVEGQLAGLGTQVERYKKYRALNNRLRDLDTHLAALELARLEQELAALQAEEAQAVDAVAALQQAAAEADKTRETERHRLADLDRRLEAERLRLLDLSRQADTVESQIMVCRERMERFAEDAHRGRQERDEVLARQETLAAQAESLAADLGAVQAEAVECAARADALTLELAHAPSLDADAQVDALAVQVQALSREEAGLIRDLENLTQRLAAADQSRAADQLRRLQEECGEAAGLRADLVARQDELSGTRDALGRESGDWNLRRQETDQQWQAAETAVEQARSALGNASARLALLCELEEEFTGYAPGVKFVLQHRDRVPGVRGVIAELLEVPPELETAVEAVLGGHVQDVVIETSAQARQWVQHLKADQGGRAMFWPLDSISSTFPVENAQALAGDAPPGMLGYLGDLVGSPPECRPLVSLLLGRVALVESAEAARAYLAAADPSSGTALAATAVTLEGDLFTGAGAVSGGAPKARTAALLPRRRERAASEGEVAAATVVLASLVAARDAVARLRQDQAARQEHLNIQVTQTHILHAEISRDVEALQERLASLETRRERAEEEVRDLAIQRESWEGRRAETGARRQELSATLQQAETALAQAVAARDAVRIQRAGVETALAEARVQAARAEQKIVGLAAARQETARQRLELDGQAARMAAQIAEAKERYDALVLHLEDIQRSKDAVSGQVEAQQQGCADVAAQRDACGQAQEEAERLADQWRAKLRSAQDEAHHLELRRVHLSTQAEECRHRLAHFEDQTRAEADRAAAAGDSVDEDTPFSMEALEELPPELAALGGPVRMRRKLPATVEEARRELERVQVQVRNFGSVNLGALEDYTQLQDRLAYLSRQIVDLEEASQSLRSVMDEIDEACARQFKDAYDAINTEFSTIFTTVFGGGQAYLLLSDPENMLETGVEIVAQPPGLRLQNLALLSSGQRALTAMAFLLAILRVKPSPFVILDELDAPLDDANVEKVALLLSEYSAQTQFIIITHNRKTMEYASMLYGVTMEEQGVSRIVSVRLEEAQELAENAERSGRGPRPAPAPV